MVRIFKYVRGNYSVKTVAVNLLDGCDNHQEIIDEFAPASIESQGFTWYREEYMENDSKVIKSSELVLGYGNRGYAKKGDSCRSYNTYAEYCVIANDKKKTILFE